MEGQINVFISLHFLQISYLLFYTKFAKLGTSA